jgi:hypothetical protein
MCTPAAFAAVLKSAHDLGLTAIALQKETRPCLNISLHEQQAAHTGCPRGLCRYDTLLAEEAVSDPALPALHYLQRRRPHLHPSVSLLAGLPYSRPAVAIGRSGAADALAGRSRSVYLSHAIGPDGPNPGI